MTMTSDIISHIFVLTPITRDRNVNSIILLSNGIAFCVELVVIIKIINYEGS